MKAVDPLRWHRSRGCGDAPVHELRTRTHLLASVAKDGGAWRAWLPGERRYLHPAGTSYLSACKAETVAYFSEWMQK